MKTTVDIADGLLREAKSYARTHGQTLREVIERGIRATVLAPESAAQRSELPDGSFAGGGEWLGLDWPEIRREIYRGRGGE